MKCRFGVAADTKCENVHTEKIEMYFFDYVFTCLSSIPANIFFSSHLKFGNSCRYFQRKDPKLAGKLLLALPNDVKIARTSDPAVASCLLPDMWRLLSAHKELNCINKHASLVLT